MLSDGEAEKKILNGRLHNLRRHIKRLASEEHREIDNETLVDSKDLADVRVSRQSDGEHSFEDEVHIHNAKLFLNNTSRNVSRDRGATDARWPTATTFRTRTGSAKSIQGHMRESLCF